MGVSIWGTVHLHSVDRWVLGGASVWAPSHGVLETVWLHCNEAQQVGCCEDRKVVCWCRTQASSHIHKVSLMMGSIRWVWALQHQMQYSVVECTRAKVAVRNMVVLEPQPLTWWLATNFSPLHFNRFQVSSSLIPIFLICSSTCLFHFFCGLPHPFIFKSSALLSTSHPFSEHAHTVATWQSSHTSSCSNPAYI